MSNPAVRVVSLQASNIMRLSAVEISWQDGQRILTLGGANGAGKSSVMHAVAMALGGMTLCPDEPLKRGESRGFIDLNLGELIVRREFWRELLSEQPAGGPLAYGEVKSRLIVRNPEGVKQEPAQRLLDRLVGKLTFDPTAFAAEDEKKQAEILRQIVGLDFTTHDEQRAIAYGQRGVYNRQYKDQLVILEAMPKHDEAPADEVSVSSLTNELQTADDLRKAASVAYEAFKTSDQSYTIKTNEADRGLRRIEQLQKELGEAQSDYAGLLLSLEHLQIARTEAAERERAAVAAVPDVAGIHARIADAEAVNEKVRANKARHDVMNTVVRYQHLATEQDAEITRLDELRAKTLRETVFPITGLGLSPTGAVTFNNLPLKQASTAEQIRVSVAIGFALNPALKLLCIKNGNALDDDSFKLIADAAEAAGGQVLMEIVTKHAADVSVFIEDGHNG